MKNATGRNAYGEHMATMRDGVQQAERGTASAVFT